MMKKDIELLKYKLEGLQEINMRMREICEPNSEEQYHLNGSLVAIEKVLEFVDDLDDTEVTLNSAFEKISEIYPMTKGEVCRHLEQVVAHGGKVTYGEPEVLSQEWVRNNQERKGVHFFVNVTKLQNLIVPKQELPLLPEYMHKWITNHRDKYDLYPALKRLEGNPLGWERFYTWYRENTHTFVNAYLTGEYEVEHKPLYHALIKGHELVNDYDIYWNCDKYDNDVFVSRLHPPHDNFTTELSKSEWNELGINDSNADFVKSDE